MKKTLSLVLSVILSLLLLSSSSGETHPVLKIGDVTTRSGTWYNAQLGMWQYLAEKAGVEIEYLYLTPGKYAAGLASGNLPDIVATRNNLSMIQENGVALDISPYLEEYCPNLLKGVAKLSYDVFRQLGDEEGFYFIPARIGYNGVGYDKTTSARGYVVRWGLLQGTGVSPHHQRGYEL